MEVVLAEDITVSDPILGQNVPLFEVILRNIELEQGYFYQELAVYVNRGEVRLVNLFQKLESDITQNKFIEFIAPRLSDETNNALIPFFGEADFSDPQTLLFYLNSLHSPSYGM